MSYDPQTQKVRRRWQNLIYLKCPICDERLNERRSAFLCPNPHPTEPGKNCFFILKAKLIELWSDPLHAAYLSLSPTELQQLPEVIKSISMPQYEQKSKTI